MASMSESAAAPVAAANGEAEAAHAACLNCGATLVGPWCHLCGQEAHVHRTLGAWWHDFLHSVLHFDGKAWRTLPLLAWRPGELTRRYIEGERKRFISPVALFLFSVFLMFASFALVGGASLSPAQQGAASAEVEREVADLEAQIDRLDAQRSRLSAQGLPTAALDGRVAQLRRELAAARTGQSAVEGDLSELNFRSGWARLDHAVEKAGRNPALLFYKVQANGYKFSWALIPLSVPFLWLLFLHRGRYRRHYGAFDHLVFVTYSIAFMSLAFVALSLLRAIGLPSGPVNLAMVLIPPVHMFRQLRQAYALGAFGAAWRTVALLVFASVALALFFLLLLGIGLLG